jgi:hypothetical protein
MRVGILGLGVSRPVIPLEWPHASSRAWMWSPAPLRMVLGSQAMAGTLMVPHKRIAAFEVQTDLAASTDSPNGE